MAAAPYAGAAAARLRCSCLQLQAGLPESVHVWPSGDAAAVTVQGIPPLSSFYEALCRGDPNIELVGSGASPREAYNPPGPRGPNVLIVYDVARQNKPLGMQLIQNPD